MSVNSNEELLQLQQKVQSLRLKVSCLEASLRHETDKNSKRNEESSIVLPYIQTIQKQDRLIEEQRNEIEEFRRMKKEKMNKLSRQEELEVCAKVLFDLLQLNSMKRYDKMSLLQSANVEQRSEEKWFDNPEYSTILSYGRSLFRDILFRDQQFNQQLKQENLIRESRKNAVYRNMVSTRGIRLQRRQHLERMRQGMGINANFIHTPIENGEKESDDAPTIESVTESKSNSPITITPSTCYICKVLYSELDSFYDKLCPECSKTNFEKRLETCDLSGRVAIVTGGRIRIGYHTALRLLRNNCKTVIVITRFPQNALKRFTTEEDFESFKDRLIVYGLDLRDLKAVEEFTEYMYNNFEHLDILINNAAQTIRRPPLYYANLVQEELMDHEKAQNESIPCQVLGKMYPTSEFIGRLRNSVLSIETNGSDAYALEYGANLPDKSANISNQLVALPGFSTDLELHLQKHQFVPASLLSIIPRIKEDLESNPEDFPKGEKDDQLEQLDKRGVNTWKHTIDDITTVEALEVHTTNTIVPFILIRKLRQLMCKSPFTARYIVNVTSVEGQFSNSFKQKYATHPHTNMSKSALNMLTMTTAPKYAGENQIFMSCVDPGWISQLCPYPNAIHNALERNFEPPLDEIDAAARILDPVFQGIKEQVFFYACYLKDYKETTW